MDVVAYISEEAAGQDLPSLLNRVLAGERILVHRDGREVAEIGPVRPVEAVARMPLKTVSQVIASLRLREATQGLTLPDESFAQDLADIRREMNESFREVDWE